MGDEDDGTPLLLQFLHVLQEFIGFLRGEHRGWFIQNEDLGIVDQRSNDLHTLLDPNGKFLDESIGVDIEVEFL